MDIYDALVEIQELGNRWHNEGVPGPNQDTIRDSSRVLEQLYDDHGILPQRVTQSVEEGIYIDFINGHRVILELYNEGGGTIIVTDYKNILDSIEIPDKDRVGITCGLIQRILRN